MRRGSARCPCRPEHDPGPVEERPRRSLPRRGERPSRRRAARERTTGGSPGAPRGWRTGGSPTSSSAWSRTCCPPWLRSVRWASDHRLRGHLGDVRRAYCGRQGGQGPAAGLTRVRGNEVAYRLIRPHRARRRRRAALEVHRWARLSRAGALVRHPARQRRGSYGAGAQAEQVREKGPQVAPRARPLRPGCSSLKSWCPGRR